MISYRKADIFEKVIKNRVYDVFFYVWFATDSGAPGGAGNIVRDYQDRVTAYTEIYFPDKFSKSDIENKAEEKIKRKIESAINQKVPQRTMSNSGEDISLFYGRLREDFEPKLRAISESVDFDSLVGHGMKFHLRMKA